MADFTWTEDITGRKLCAKVAEVLDRASVPNVLWNEYMLCAHGLDKDIEIYTVVDRDTGRTEAASVEQELNVSFIIPDDQIEDAYIELLKAKFDRCADNEDECELFRKYFLKPARHFHLCDRDKYGDPLSLNLYRQSDLLWWMPPIPLARPAEGDKYFTVTGDDWIRLETKSETYPVNMSSQTQLPDSHYQIKILTLDKVVEALMLLECVYYQIDHSGCSDCWLDWLKELKTMVSKKDIKIGPMKEYFQPIWDKADEHGISDMLKELGKKLEDKGGCPGAVQQ
ncbi:hypothetical protein BO94DRAFT_551187 [Aspergillus sclerotioniger CBS 115572]|uniref:Uncharacterized protein n=1 Tax=Aspergillus sclerotioniger CBS 115572 TaxID=1450535 RepID=A0A317V794_9EURO|nr:hypothetical protein BO94DRAFT_551187 [Aspergillus sclerotioniger CBS 115572]PWY68010.1 hypothetical protein BO94DRAFT_551187 [Aspergillus sclerotioniger CBS 115572]